VFIEKGDHYYLNSTEIMYSENAFPNGEGDEVQTIGAYNMTAYPTEKNSSYACEYAAEIQLNLEAKHPYGLKLTPAKWEAFSDFGNRTTLANPKHCKADSVVTNAEKGAWNITTTPDKDGNVTVCGRLELGAIVNINYTSILQEDMTTGFAMPNVSDIVYDKMDKCANESLSVTFLMNELDVNFANMTLNFTSFQQDVNSSVYWSMSASSISYMSGNTPFFPNSNAKNGIEMLSVKGLDTFNSTYGNAYKCKNVNHVNVTDWQLILSDVMIQPFNISTDGSYGAIEDCTADSKDDWLVPVIVGSVLGGLVIVVIVAYIIGRRKHSNDYESAN